MLQTVIRPSIERLRIASPRYSMTWPARQHDVLGRNAGRSLALDRDGHGLGPLLGEGLGSQYVLHLARANAEGEGAEGAVG
jgi:hypothetical protein